MLCMLLHFYFIYTEYFSGSHGELNSSHIVVLCIYACIATCMYTTYVQHVIIILQLLIACMHAWGFGDDLFCLKIMLIFIKEHDLVVLLIFIAWEIAHYDVTSIFIVYAWVV